MLRQEADERLKQEIREMIADGISPETLAEALAGALVWVKCDGWRSKPNLGFCHTTQRSS